MRKSKKFRSSLVKQIKEDEKERLHQEELKEKYDIKDNNYIEFVNNLFKTTKIDGIECYYNNFTNILLHQALQVYEELLELL